MRSRTGQGISLNVIIVAAIALVVMVILIALVMNSGRNIGISVNSCEALGDEGVDYKCINPAFESCGDDWTKNPTRGCSDSTKEMPLVCCIPSIT